MRRGGPIARKTPLKSTKPLKSGKSGSSLKRTEFKRSSVTRTDAAREAQARLRERQAKKAAKEHNMDWREVRRIIFERCAGRCEGCSDPLTFERMEAHHRRTRAVGPDCPCNALALCRSCHHGPTVHGGPKQAHELGRIISRHFDGEKIREHPVKISSLGRVRLTCTGEYDLAA